MAKPSFENNDELVDHLVRAGYITSETVERAFRSVDRKNFVPEEAYDEAYNDYPISIGEDATISAPHMVAINTELLEVEKENKIIEIGSGSGYQVAILSELAESVLGIEINKNLVKKSRERLSDRDNVEIRHGNGLEDIERKFDRIIYSCAIEDINKAMDNLEEEGIIVAPVVKEGYQVMEKYKGGEVTRHDRVRFVKMKEEN